MRKMIYLSLVLYISFTNILSAGTYSGGDGSQGNPYLIANANDMQEIGATPADWGKHFLMTADIDLSQFTGTQFNIIGTYGGNFTGVFDGDGHTISNFTYATAAGFIGLFGEIGTCRDTEPNTIIKNTTLIAPDVYVSTTSSTVGSLVGNFRSGTISNCHAFNVNIFGNYAGGLVGGFATCQSKGTIINCSVSGTVSGHNGAAGGLVGNLNNHGSFDFFSQSIISNCYADCDVSCVGLVGGLAGWLCTYKGTITISNCYATGNVSGVFDNGGLVGVVDIASFGEVEILNSYAAATVSGSPAGGFIGREYDGTPSYTKCFWDSTLNPNLDGISNRTDPDVIAKTTVQMQTESTFTDAGWDFVGETINGPNDIWRLCNEGTEYPQLNWQYPVGDFVCPDGVNFVDFSILALAWLSGEGDDNWNPVCDISEPNDSFIDELDLALFADHWLEDNNP